MMVKTSSCILAFLIAMPACGQDKQSQVPKTALKTQTLAVGKGPDALFLTPGENYLYVANVEDAFISVIDARNDSVITKNDERLYVTNTNDGTISIINVNTKTATAISTGGKPELIHYNEDHSLLYISNFVLNKIHILSTETDKIIHEITGLDGPEEAVLSKSGRRLFVVNFNNSKVLSFDARTYAKQAQEFAVGKQPIGVVSAANDRKLYVTNFGDNSVTVIHW